MSECPSGKAPYPSQREASEVANHMKRKKGAGVHAYRCPDCGEWHIGHPTGSKKGRSPGKVRRKYGRFKG